MKSLKCVNKLLSHGLTMTNRLNGITKPLLLGKAGDDYNLDLGISWTVLR